MNECTTTCAPEAHAGTTPAPTFSPYVPPRGPMQIASLAIASTLHITMREAELLDAAGYACGDYGWLLYVGQHGDPVVVPEIDASSEGLAAVIARAREHDCLYLLLDRAADLVEGVPVYDW